MCITGTKTLVFFPDSYSNLNLVESPPPLVLGQAKIIQPSEGREMNKIGNIVIKNKLWS